MYMSGIFTHGGGERIHGVGGGSVFVQLLAAAGGHDAEPGLTGQGLHPGRAVQQDCSHPPHQDEAWRESQNSGFIYQHRVLVVLMTGVWNQQRFRAMQCSCFAGTYKEQMGKANFYQAGL